MHATLHKLSLALAIGCLANGAFAQASLPELSSTTLPEAPPLADEGLKAGTPLGFYDAASFVELSSCAACEATPQTRFYFKGDYAVSPRKGSVGFDKKELAFDDLRQWVAGRKGKPSGELPSLVWLGSPHVIEGTLSADGQQLVTASGSIVPFSIVPKISTNLSYYDDSSAKFFANRKVVARASNIFHMNRRERGADFCDVRNICGNIINIF
jgi:hypothetical protein